MAGNREIAEIGKDLLNQIASDDQDNQELGDDLDNNDAGDQDNSQQGDKFKNEFTDHDEDDDLEHDASDLGSDAPKKGDEVQKPAPKQEQTKPTGTVEDIWNPDYKLKQDRAGNLLNAAGQIVVRAGRERKFFEDAKKRVSAAVIANDRLAGNMTKIAGAAKELHQRYLTLQDQKGMFDKAGLSNDEQLQMLQVASEYKKNPVDGIKKLLTMAAMQGVDLKTLGVAGGIDAHAIAEEIRKGVAEQLKPITDRETASSADREALEAATKTAQEFFDDNPDALEARNEMGGDEFNKIIFGAKQKFPHMSLTEIWLRIKLAAANKGPAPTQDRGQQRNERRATEVVDDRRPRRPARNTGSESFDDIGRSVLRDLQTSLRT